MVGAGRTIGVVAVLLLVASAGCKKKDSGTTTDPDDTTTLAQDGSDSSAVEVDHELLAGSLVGGSSSGTLQLASASDLGGATLATANVGDGAKSFFFPRGCLTTADDPATSTVTYTFNGCSGPAGLLRVTGEVKAHYVSEANKLTLDLVGTGLEINKATADWHATAVITADGPLARTMTWNAQLSGTTARGRTFTRTNSKTISWRVGDRCFQAAGVSEGDIRGRNLRTEVTDYRRCAGACPEAGGTITITNVSSGKQVAIAFDGSATAKVTTANGDKRETLDLPLLCSAN